MRILNIFSLVIVITTTISIMGSGASRKEGKSFGWLTVDCGQCAVVSDKSGNTLVYKGPARPFVWFGRVHFCAAHSANERQYLLVHYVDGSTQHIRGPKRLHIIPSLISSIVVKDAIEVSFGQAIVVYTRDNSLPSSKSANPIVKELDHVATTEPMSRNIHCGPLLFFPKVNQTLHQFSWHGETAAAHPSQTRVLANMKKFTHMSLLQEQMYYNVRDVSTSCDSSLTIKLMIVYTVKNVSKMLDNTNDPVGEICNALCADIIEWSAKRTYETVLQEAGRLSNMEIYSRLTATSNKIGFEINHIQYRGYKGEPNVARANVLKRRLDLKLRKEEAEEKERMQTFKLEQEIERVRRQEEKANAQAEARIERKKREQNSELEHCKNMHAEEIEHYNKLKTMGVDLTKFLVAKSYADANGKHNMVHLINSSADGRSPTPHIHIKQQTV